MTPQFFHPAAVTGYVLATSPAESGVPARPESERPYLHLHPRANPRETALARDFLRRYGLELLLAQQQHSLATAPLLAATALATSGGNPAYNLYRPSIAAQLHDRIDPTLLEGPPRETLCYVGLFGFPLPLMRHWLSKPDLTVAAAQQTRAVQFPLATANITGSVLAALERQQPVPDPLVLALLLHGTNMQPSTLNPFRVGYRNDFLPQFIAFYNTLLDLI